MKRLLVVLPCVWELLGCNAKSGGGLSSTLDGGTESDVVISTDSTPSGDQVAPSTLTLQIPTWTETYAINGYHPDPNEVFLVATISLNNMSDSEPAPLLPSSFSVTTSDGLLVYAGAAYDLADQCRSTVSVAPGGMTTCKLVIPIATSARPIRMTYRTESRTATAEFPMVTFDFDCETGWRLAIWAANAPCSCPQCSTQLQNFIRVNQDPSCQSEIAATYHHDICLPTNGPIMGTCATAWFDASRCYALNCYTTCRPPN